MIIAIIICVAVVVFVYQMTHPVPSRGEGRFGVSPLTHNSLNGMMGGHETKCVWIEECADINPKAWAMIDHKTNPDSPQVVHYWRDEWGVKYSDLVLNMLAGFEVDGVAEHSVLEYSLLMSKLDKFPAGGAFA